MKGPNLFDSATGELSQDAFIIWLSRWGDKKYKDDGKLHELGKAFILNLFKTAKVNLTEEILSVKTIKQRHKIDILIVVNKSNL